MHTLFNPKIKIDYSYWARILILLFLVLCGVYDGNAQNMPIPENIQAALLPKVLKFNPKISAKAKIKMLIVYDNNSQNNKDEFVKALGNSMDIKAILPNELENNIAAFDLVYFMPGMDYKSRICREYKVLSVTGISQYVEKGQISLGFGVQNNKPKIFVNLTSLEAEGQSLSSDILRIAKIFN